MGLRRLGTLPSLDEPITVEVHFGGDAIDLPGETSFEACDLLDAEGSLIHAKRKSRSSTMSHLFVQAERSCQLLTEVNEARVQLREQIAAASDGLDASASLRIADALGDRGHGLHVVFALLGDWHRRTLRNLPLLTKITLVATTAAIRRLGFATSVALVPLCSRE